MCEQRWVTGPAGERLLSPVSPRSFDLAKRVVANRAARQRMAVQTAELTHEIASGAPLRRVTDRLLALAERSAELEADDLRGRRRNPAA